jgi:hypothetical protein
MSYTGKLASYEAKFENIAKKFKNVLELNSENSKEEIFAKALLNPNKALLESEKSEILEFVKAACENGLQAEIKECKSVKSHESIDDLLLITKIKELVEGGVVDTSAYQDKQLSYEDQANHLVELLESAEEAMLYNKKYPAITEMNTAVRELRDSVFSLNSEFKPSNQNEEFGADAGKVRDSFDSDFKKTAEVLKDVWGSGEDQNTALAVYADNPVSIHRPEFYSNPRIDSKEAMENLDTKASGHFVGAVGAMQVAYFKDIALPYLIKGVCKLANTNSDLSSQIQDHVAFQKAKYVMANFKAIFRGMESDYISDIEKAYEDMQDIRVKDDGVSSYDLDAFFAGINRVIKIVSFNEQQHEGFKSDIESISDLCPELNFSNAVPLLGMVSTEESVTHDEM